jgi:hypothetical protein
MRKSSEPTIRPVSELYYSKSPEDALFNMSQLDKGRAFVDERAASDVEKTKPELAVRKARGYEPSTKEEKALDKSLNFKLDTIVVVICAVNFVLQGIDKGNIGNAATTKSKSLSLLEINAR